MNRTVEQLRAAIEQRRGRRKLEDLEPMKLQDVVEALQEFDRATDWLVRHGGIPGVDLAAGMGVILVVVCELIVERDLLREELLS
jgi:hypothetical protein